MTLNAEQPDALSIILAAGSGTRMKSRLPKVLHSVAGRPMLGHVASTAAEVGGRIVVVISPGATETEEFVKSTLPEALVCYQRQQLGTANAVEAARAAFETFPGDVLVLYGDAPLIPSAALAALRDALNQGASLAILGFCAADPTGYGRLLLDQHGRPAAIREHKDASSEERAVSLCNSGIIAVRGGDRFASLLSKVGNANAAQEYYLTDIVAIARSEGLTTALVTCAGEETLGVNDRAQLAQAEAIMQKRLRADALANGVTMIAPDTVTLAYDTKLGQDVLIEPNVVFGPGVTVEDGAVIRAFSHIEGAHIGRNAQIGPYARLRPGVRLGEGARIGNFVELKNAVIEEGAKVNHLSYIGDARVGVDANVGAGTITCNYDGFDKHQTDIGEGAFIGSNTSLVAPVKIGKGAYIGSGSVITRDVGPDALAVARGVQAEKPGWAAAVRERRHRERKPPHA
ncbi:MAG: bifunctional UDP-N-acetylglucosamine diphosphorylase/glucosamine-1-phosphate N-acetyltransferase GlmU [Hyphomicrobiales bacterium]|nr:bifunctional UDP-N-acetylglucosamine diphosphorylase/glucosamine-1-phosphate N-acetyltransferase GlmU [Hyphomicrobiales bacterium]